MRIALFCIIVITVFFTKCSSDDIVFSKKPYNKGNKIIKKNDVIKQQDIEESFTFPSFAILNENYSAKNVNSGTMNKPVFLMDCDTDLFNNFGYYDILDNSVSSDFPVIAKVYVSYKNTPWDYSDSLQKIVAILVRNKKFSMPSLPLEIGDSINTSCKQFKCCEIDGIVYLERANCKIAINQIDGRVLKYFIWKSNIKKFDFRKYHHQIKSILDCFSFNNR